MIHRPPLRRQPHLHFHLTMRGELHRIRKQVLQNLLQALWIARHRTRQTPVKVHMERQVLRFRHMPEVAVDSLPQTLEADIFHIHRHCARFDLRQIQNVIDQIQQIRPR